MFGNSHIHPYTHNCRIEFPRHRYPYKDIIFWQLADRKNRAAKRSFWLFGIDATNLWPVLTDRGDKQGRQFQFRRFLQLTSVDLGSQWSPKRSEESGYFKTMISLKMLKVQSQVDWRTLARCPSFDFAMLCIAPGPCIQLDQPKLVKEHIEESWGQSWGVSCS